MRIHLVTVTAALMVAATAALGLATAAIAQNSVPTEIGNRANGLSYQPTPSEVLPREKAAGLLQSPAQRDATSQELERMDKELLREEGLSTKSVPNLASPPQ